MPPKNINDFFSPVSTGTNPHQQIDDLILMEELDKIAQEDMMYGAMTQFQPDVHAPTVTPFALDAELAPLKAMGWMLGKGKGIKDVVKHGKETVYDLFNKTFRRDLHTGNAPITEEAAIQLNKNIVENLPDVGYIEGKAERLKDVNKELDELGELMFSTNLDLEEYTALDNRISQLVKTMGAENLRPGAGLTEPYHISYPHSKSGSEVIPFDPIEVHKGYDMTEKGGKEFIAKHGEEAWQKEVSAYKKSQEDLEDWNMVEIENASQTLGDELSWWFEEEIVKRNINIDALDVEGLAKLVSEFPHIDKLVKSKYMLKEMELRQEIRWEQQKTLRDILEGKPY